MRDIFGAYRSRECAVVGVKEKSEKEAEKRKSKTDSLTSKATQPSVSRKASAEPEEA